MITQNAIPEQPTLPKRVPIEIRHLEMTIAQPAFEAFLEQAGVEGKIEISVNPRHRTNACDRLICHSDKFTVMSVPSTNAVRLYADLPSGSYRSELLSTPDELAQKLDLLECERDRIKALPAWRKIPRCADPRSQLLMLPIMVLSYIYAPETSNARLAWSVATVALTAAAFLAQASQVENSVIDEAINLL
jgi:hypothetical protein